MQPEKLPDSQITASIGFDKDGAHHGFLRLPYSRDDSAWGSLMIPISVIRNGSGPIALFTGANHGDEYEGPIALQNLAINLNPADIHGTVIIVPAFNYPAFRAGTRTSPIDQGNMNRSFPGSPTGSVTEKIADYFQRVLIPQANFIVDFHSGGKTLDFIPFAAAHVLENKGQQDECVATMHAFNAPYSMMLLEIDNVGMYDTAAEDQGKVFLSTELGGGGTATAQSIAIAKKGLRNILIHSNILSGEMHKEATINLDMPSADCYLIAEHEGLLEPLKDLGEPVKAGAIIAQVWPTDRTGVAPIQYKSKIDGILAGRHFPGLVKGGDCVAVVAVVV